MTTVAIDGERFVIDGRRTYEGVSFRGRSIEGLLCNVRAVQATFDDENPRTRDLWRYPDGGAYDADRQTEEFCRALPLWRRHGVLAVTVNFQGGGPAYRFPYHKPDDNPAPNPKAYLNSAFARDGSLKPAYLDRLGRVLTAADRLGMMVIVGLFYFQQDGLLADESAVVRAVDGAADWLLATGHANVLVEINNECNIRYDHAVLQPDRVHELIARVVGTRRDGRRLLVGTSGGGGWLPTDAIVEASDFVLVHGNGQNAQGHRRMIEQIRANPIYAAKGKPIVFNESHIEPSCLLMCAELGVSWGFYNQGRCDYCDGYQSPPTNWGINTAAKRAFFGTAARLTTGQPIPPTAQPELLGFDGVESGETLSGTVFVHAKVNDPTYVDRVELRIDGELVCRQNVAPYWLGEDIHKTPLGFDVGALSVGRHELTARMVTTFGQEQHASITFQT